MKIEKLYSPSPWQSEFHARTEWEVMGGGSAGPGKTTCLRIDPFYQYAVDLERCKNERHPFHIPPGTSKGLAVLFRREKRHHDQNIKDLKVLWRTIEPGIHFNGETLTWTSWTGFQYQLGHCKDEGDEANWQGPSITWLGFDELTQFLESQYTYLMTRVRTTDPVLSTMLKIRSMTNPVVGRTSGDSFSVRDPQWVRRRFVDMNPPGQERVVFDYQFDLGDGTTITKSRLFLPALIDDNPDPSFVRTYKANLASIDQVHVRNALLKGDWYATADSYYADVWDQRIHVCNPFKIPDHWPIFRACDWGYKKPGVVLWGAKDPDGPLYVIYELTFRLKPIKSEHGQTGVADLIKSIEKRFRLWKDGASMITGPADTQLWEQREGGTKTKAQQFAECGISWMPANKKSRADNARRVHSLLADHANYTQTPGLVIFSVCSELIRTIPTVQTDPDNSEEPLDGGADHHTDTAWYLAAYAEGRVQSAKRSDDDDDDPPPKKDAPVGRWGPGWGYL